MAIVINTTDRLESIEKQKIIEDIRQHFPYPIIPVSAKNKINIERIHTFLI